MAPFFLFILIILLVVFLSIVSFGLSIIRGILGLFFPGKRPSQSYAGGHRSNSERTDFEPQSKADQVKNQKKIFDKNDGEYVDYEEVSR